MIELTTLVVAITASVVGIVLGYYARQSIARRDHRALENKVQRRIDYARKKSEAIIKKAKERSSEILETAKKETEEKSDELFRREKFLLKRENTVDQKLTDYEQKEKLFNQKVRRLRALREEIDKMQKEAKEKLSQISGMSKDEAREGLFKVLEEEYEADILERVNRLEKDGEERYLGRAKEILASVIQKYSTSQSQELTTTNVSLPSDEIKGRIIGKEGRNIKTLEKLTGVEIVVDDTP